MSYDLQGAAARSAAAGTQVQMHCASPEAVLLAEHPFQLLHGPLLWACKLRPLTSAERGQYQALAGGGHIAHGIA